MWRVKVDVFYEPHCELMQEDLQVVIPVCRDKLREKAYRIAKWEKEGWNFEKLKLEESSCETCEPSLFKSLLERLLKR